MNAITTTKNNKKTTVYFFFNIANYASLFAFKHSVSKDTKSHRRVKQVSPKPYVKRYKQQK